MKRRGSAVWQGELKGGSGTVSTESGILSATPYSFTTRFENGAGTNPEELIAAAHAGCFSMALAAQLGGAGLKPDSISTSATVFFDKLDEGWTVSRVHLDVAAKVPGATREGFESAAFAAKKGCPVSRLLQAEITMEAKLVS
ncbi:osmotically inducible protein OsmC [Geotalea uraniireducens]|uniref:Osmotically inducible protein OsmC n=2 Tax=Geotalea uraniireducens TaxID=351604 RepID=A0ABM8EKK5_9BACT|nr:osmotically inducible protein OsmC [Geotalea uraniireducens]